MHRRLFKCLLLSAACAAQAPTALAQDLPYRGRGEGAEWRIGVVAHNIHPFGYGDMQSRETGPNLEGEMVGAPSQTLRAIGRPRPYVMASANLSGDTSFAAAGLYWPWRFDPDWRLEFGVGLALHDGELHNPYPASDPRAAAFQYEHQLLGTHMLFRDSLALDRAIGAGCSVGIVYEHLSNAGDLFGHSDNESLNELGVRFSMGL